VIKLRTVVVCMHVAVEALVDKIGSLYLSRCGLLWHIEVDGTERYFPYTPFEHEDAVTLQSKVGLL
jgi:hypothetical protein